MNILVTGGAGFIGSNLTKKLKETYPKSNITVLDNYFTGKPKNHIPDVEYISGNTWDAKELLAGCKFDIVYHFGEYSRIVKSFDDIQYVIKTILYGTPIILDLCLEWNAKVIYSASSSKFGNDGKDENLSPYAWCKSKMVELIKNYSKWFGLKYEICYFYNVYGPNQIVEGDYATVIGIFEKQYKENKSLTVVTPGTQSRDFTHVEDIVEGLIKVTEQDEQNEWHLRSGKNITILEVATLFDHKWEFVPERKGERFTSKEFPSDTQEKLDWKPKHTLKNWIDKIKNENQLCNHSL
jgi:UDP-glucose 4-epimerase